MRSIAILALMCTGASAFSPGSNDSPFSLSAYQKARAKETSNGLDASRFHFQILFVDNDNFHGRIAEGMLAKIAEYNDALFTLFPYSATIEASPKAPINSDAPKEAISVCDTLGLCSTTCSEDGTAFDLSYLDQYDLIIAMDDDIQSLILRSLPAESGYEQKCRLLSEFLSINFCGIQSKNGITDKSLQDMIEPSLWDRAQPFYDLAKNSPSDIFAKDSTTTWNDVYQPRVVLNEGGAAVPNLEGWPLIEAAMLVACGGLVKFCLDTMDAQFDASFQNLLDMHFYRVEDLEFTTEEADDRLRLGSLSVTGYFSPKERHARIENHLEELRSRFL